MCERCFGDLQNYTTLKLMETDFGIVLEFWRFTELHYSQTFEEPLTGMQTFWRFTELHYSQTFLLALIRL